MEVRIKKSSLKKAGLIFTALVFVAAAIIVISSVVQAGSKTEVLIQTNLGNITVQLYPNKAPITVQNFENYVNSGFYDGTVFHRVIKGFVIQGGGYTSGGTLKATNAPIKLESNNGLTNLKYTIAMARTSNPNSATSQFFINTADNTNLNYASGNPGYAVFGKVVSGFNVVDTINNVQVGTKYGMQDWPLQNVIIEKISMIK